MPKKKKSVAHTDVRKDDNVTRVVSQSSVEISRSAKGVTQISVKIYDDDPAEAAKRAKKIYDGLAKGYPYVE